MRASSTSHRATIWSRSRLRRVELGVFQHPAVDLLIEHGQIDLGQPLVLGPIEQLAIADRTLGAPAKASPAFPPRE